MSSILLGAFRSLSKSFAQRQLMRANVRKTLRQRAAFKNNSRLGVRSSEIVEAIAELQQQASDVVEAAFYKAMDTMFGMTVNPGQETVFNQQVVPAFADTLVDRTPDDGWEDVNIGEYMAFMGEIVGVGNNIMEIAYEQAADLLEESYFLEFELANFSEETGEPLDG